MQCGVLVNFYPTSALVERYFYDKKTNQIISTDGHVIYNYNQKRWNGINLSLIKNVIKMLSLIVLKKIEDEEAYYS